MRFLKELFAFMGLEGRLRLEWISSAEAQKFVKVMSEFTEEIRALGPNPMCTYSFEPGKPGKKFSACPAGKPGFSDQSPIMAAGG
jgi:F420-non-reducing hydrogenase iron-sulfur subunit